MSEKIVRNAKITEPPNPIARSRKEPLTEAPLGRRTLKKFRALTRKNADQAMEAAMGDHLGVKYLAELLSDRSFVVRVNAAKALLSAVQCGADASNVVGKLEQAMEGKHQEVRSIVVEIFSLMVENERTNKAAVNWLLKALGDSNPDVQLAAACEFEEISWDKVHDKSVILTLTELMGSGPRYNEVQDACVRALGAAAISGIDIAPALPALVERVVIEKAPDAHLRGVMSALLADERTKDAAWAHIMRLHPVSTGAARYALMDVLQQAAEDGVDISPAIRFLTQTWIENLAPKSAEILRLAAGHGGKEVVAGVVAGMQELAGSEWFCAEAERNSRKYVESAQLAATVMDAARARLDEVSRT